MKKFSSRCELWGIQTPTYKNINLSNPRSFTILGQTSTGSLFLTLQLYFACNSNIMEVCVPLIWQHIIIQSVVGTGITNYKLGSFNKKTNHSQHILQEFIYLFIFDWYLQGQESNIGSQTCMVCMKYYEGNSNNFTCVNCGNSYFCVYRGIIYCYFCGHELIPACIFSHNIHRENP